MQYNTSHSLDLRKKLEQGNVEEVFQCVDQIIEGEVQLGGQEHFYMETQSVCVVPKEEDKEIDIYVSSQDAAFTQEMVACTLSIPKNRINCHVKRVGGVFGGKASKSGQLAAVAAVTAHKTGCPVCFILECGDDMLITSGRHPLLGKYKIGFMNNGKIEAADVEYHINGGCTPDDSELVIEYALLKLENAYKIPNLQVRGRACKTNLPSNTAFRGFGFPQGAFVTETWITAVASKCYLPPEMAAALVHIYTDGSVFIAHGGVELGQGIDTKMMQVASHEFQIPMSRIHVGEMNTMTVPNTIATAASTGADVNGKVVQNACQTLMKRLEPIVSQNPKGTWKEWVNEAFTQSISLSATGYFRGYEAHMDWEKGEGDIYPYFVFGAACSEVEIDCLTGAHKNIRTDIVMDSSLSINPAVDIGQIEGAFVQGLGLYTLEELKCSPEGVLYTRGPTQYKIPSVTDIPEELHVSLLTTTQNPKVIYSSKGLGESGMFLGSSVFFTIADAVAAACRERGLAPLLAMNSPATPEQIRMACVNQFTELIPQIDSKGGKPWSISVA